MPASKKKCTKCGAAKSVDEFYRNSGRRFKGAYHAGRHHHCKTCSKKRVALLKAHKKGLAPSLVCDYVADDLAHAGACQCCGLPEPIKGRSLAWDHDKKTGAIRGWLCSFCNMGIGMLGDNAEGVAKALAYLSKVPGNIA